MEGKLVFGQSLTTSPDISAFGSAVIELAEAEIHVLKARSVRINDDAQIDVKDNKVITEDRVGTATDDVYDGVQGLVQSGLNTGTWDGPGLVTTMSDAQTGLTTLCISTGAIALSLGTGDTTIWAGETVSADNTLVMYSYAGDANLDGLISGDDYAAIDFNINTSADGYYNGDFNYDGVVSGDDYSTIDFNYAAQSDPFWTSSGTNFSVTPVPEPVTPFLAGLIASYSLLLRRRRRPARITA
jgi:hypothetical protein